MHQYDKSSDKEDGWSDRRHHNRRRVIDELRGTGQEGASAAAQRAADQTPRGANPRRSDGSASGAELAFIYVRVSTREQARTGGGEEGYSIPAQRAACTEKAKQLGAVMGGIYIDAGESAKSIRRPELQRMLRDIEEQRPRYVIVHKIDRLARNRMDDVAINMALRKAGSELVSCTENISDTPSGKFLYNVMADMAQFYSDNLAQEVNKGLLAKAQDGGTPFRPPLGYLPCRDYHDGILVSSVVVDQQRAPLMKWAFEQYATGDWTAQRLMKALREKGLTTRPTARRPERDVSLTSLLNMLRNPYYMGVVSYRGVTYEGKHEALVTPELWLTVQDVLAVHAHAGEKDRVHTHYLRGTIFCGGCGRRLIFTRATGRHGGTFDYFICPKRHHEEVRCVRRAIRIERIEDGILELYQRLEMPAETVRSIRLGVQAEMAGESVEAHRQAERSNASLKKLGQERAVLMQAHYAGAVPLDLLKTEMDRLTRAMAAAERQVEVSGKLLAEVEAVLEQALAVAAECNVQYRRAPEFVRRQMNQGFYKKLWIAQDGMVEHCELTEPFAALLGWGGLPAGRQVGRGLNKDQRRFEAGQAGLGGQLETPTSGEGRGLNENVLVELKGLEPLTLDCQEIDNARPALPPGTLLRIRLLRTPELAPRHPSSHHDRHHDHRRPGHPPPGRGGAERLPIIYPCQRQEGGAGRGCDHRVRRRSRRRRGAPRSASGSPAGSAREPSDQPPHRGRAQDLDDGRWSARAARRSRCQPTPAPGPVHGRLPSRRRRSHRQVQARRRTRHHDQPRRAVRPATAAGTRRRGTSRAALQRQLTLRHRSRRIEQRLVHVLRGDLREVRSDLLDGHSRRDHLQQPRDGHASTADTRDTAHDLVVDHDPLEAHPESLERSSSAPCPVYAPAPSSRRRGRRDQPVSSRVMQPASDTWRRSRGVSA